MFQGPVRASCSGAGRKPVGDERTLVAQRHPVAASEITARPRGLCVELGVGRDLKPYQVQTQRNAHLKSIYWVLSTVANTLFQQHKSVDVRDIVIGINMCLCVDINKIQVYSGKKEESPFIQSNICLA